MSPEARLTVGVVVAALEVTTGRTVVVGEWRPELSGYRTRGTMDCCGKALGDQRSARRAPR